MRFEESFLEELQDRINLVELVDRTVPLKRSGSSNYQACCPFHEEKTPSFVVSESKQIFHCFGCGAHGNAFNWLQDHAGLEFVDAVKELAGIAGVPLPENKKDSEQSSEESKNAYSLCFKLRDILRKDFHDNPINLPFSNDVADQLQLGRAVRGRLVNGMLKKYQDIIDTSPAKADRKQSKPGLADSNGLIAPLTTRKGAVTGFVFFDSQFKPTPMPLHPTYQPGEQWLNNHRVERGERLYVAYDLPSFALANRLKNDGVVILEPRSRTQLSDKQVKFINRQTDEAIFCLPKTPQREVAAVYSLLRHWKPEHTTSVLPHTELLDNSPSPVGLLDHIVANWDRFPADGQSKLASLLEKQGLGVIPHLAAQSKLNNLDNEHQPPHFSNEKAGAAMSR